MAQDIEERILNIYPCQRHISDKESNLLHLSPDLKPLFIFPQFICSGSTCYKLAALEKGKLEHAYGFKLQILEMDSSSWIQMSLDLYANFAADA